jgi:hypothetical protein
MVRWCWGREAKVAGVLADGHQGRGERRKKLPTGTGTRGVGPSSKDELPTSNFQRPISK